MDRGIPTIDILGDAWRCFGPARFRTRFLSTLEVRMLESINDGVSFSNDGTWFMNNDQYYFSNRDDAVLFKLRHG